MDKQKQSDELNEWEQFLELSYYTGMHRDPAFIHQLAVDAFGAQVLTPESKPVTAVMTLVGLYLHNEHGYSGKAVQDVHVLLGKRDMPDWPTFILPTKRGDVRVADVLAVEEGEQRDDMIEQWNKRVWVAYKPKNQKRIQAYLRERELLA